MVCTKPTHSAQQLPRRTTATSTGHTQGSVVDNDRQVQEFGRHRDVLCDLSIGLHCVLTGDVRTRGALAQKHENRADPRDAWSHVDVGIKILRNARTHSELDESIVQSLQPTPQLRSKTIEVKVRSKPAANTHQSPLSSRPSASTQSRWP